MDSSSPAASYRRSATASTLAAEHSSTLAEAGQSKREKKPNVAHHKRSASGIAVQSAAQLELEGKLLRLPFVTLFEYLRVRADAVQRCSPGQLIYLAPEQSLCPPSRHLAAWTAGGKQQPTAPHCFPHPLLPFQSVDHFCAIFRTLSLVVTRLLDFDLVASSHSARCMKAQANICRLA